MCACVYRESRLSCRALIICPYDSASEIDSASISRSMLQMDQSATLFRRIVLLAFNQSRRDVICGITVRSRCGSPRVEKLVRPRRGHNSAPLISNDV